jgi:hypothetical protein
MRISGIFLFFRHKDTRNTYFFTFFDLQHEHQHSNTQIKGYTIFYNTHWCPIFMLWGINVVCGVRRGQSVRVASLGLVLFGCCISGLTIVQYTSIVTLLTRTAERRPGVRGKQNTLVTLW